MKDKRCAFTLIELLIVVAIISILAAIAVPNFLEAQTRAKVSLAKSNMRTMATAIECYRIDIGAYPPIPDFSWLRGSAFPYMLTTPVAYVSGSIEDPFAAQALGSSDHGLDMGLTCLFYYGGLREMVRGWANPATMRFTQIGNILYHHVLFPLEMWERYEYGIASVGPDLMPGYFGTPQEFAERPGGIWSMPHAVIYYDPTNGTKSLGNIYYYGPGGGIDPSPQPGREDCWQEELHP